MPSSPCLCGLRTSFEHALLSAITEGRILPRIGELGPETRSVIHAIAQHHPEATCNLITDAYDAFYRESVDTANKWPVSASAPCC